MAQHQTSSFLVFLRGLIMVSSLIVFSYLALTGHSLPDGIRRLIPEEIQSLSKRLLPQQDSRGKSEMAGVEAPPFGLQPRSDQLTAASVAVDELLVMQPESAGEQLVKSPMSDELSVYARSSADPEFTASPDFNEDRDLGRIEERLKSLGAVAYHLEEWGSGDNLYRFVCELSLNDQQTCRRHFEAIETSPLLAMRKVLAGVEDRLAGSR